MEISSTRISYDGLIRKTGFLEAFRSLDPNMPVSQIIFLLQIAAQPDSSLLQLAEAVKVPHASASRYLTALSDGRPAVGLPGLGLVQAIENPRNRRAKIISLTSKGTSLLAGLV